MCLVNSVLHVPCVLFWLVFSERELDVHVRYMSSSVRLSVICL